LGVTDAFIVWNRGDLYRLSRDDDSHKQLMDKTFAKVSGGIALGRGYGVKGVSGDHVILNAPAYEQAVNGTTIASVFKQWLNNGKSHFVTDNSPEYKGIPVTERLTVKEGKAGFNKKALPTAVLLGDLDCDGNDTLQKQVTSSGYNFVWIDHCKGRTRKGDSLNRIKQATSAVLPEDQIIDAFDAISWINQQDWHKGPVVLIGQAMGGAAINYLAYGRTRDRILERSSISAEAMSFVSGLVSYYPFCAVGRMPPTADVPYLGFIAGDDDFDLGMNGCNVIANKKTGEMQIKYIPNAPHGFDKEAYAGDKTRTGITKGGARYKIAYDSKSEKAASKELKAFLSVVR
jgi:dienelactone hydrolase